MARFRIGKTDNFCIIVRQRHHSSIILNCHEAVGEHQKENLHEKCRFFCVYQKFFVPLQPK